MIIVALMDVPVEDVYPCACMYVSLRDRRKFLSTCAFECLVCLNVFWGDLFRYVALFFFFEKASF